MKVEGSDTCVKVGGSVSIGAGGFTLTRRGFGRYVIGGAMNC